MITAIRSRTCGCVVSTVLDKHKNKRKVHYSMLPIPDSIERYLRDSGFSGTEILVLQSLCGDAMRTVRGLARATGKSAGVLGRALRKLRAKGVVAKSAVNGSPRYGLASYESIGKAVGDDLRRKLEAAKRKEREVEAFVREAKRLCDRPDAVSFEGLSGMRDAFAHLLSAGPEMLLLSPRAEVLGETHRAFLAERAAQRRSKGVFARVIAEDSPGARRDRSSDVFALRRTLLVPPLDESSLQERVICGDTVGYFDYGRERAFLLTSRSLAETERSAFELLWGAMVREEQREEEMRAAVPHACDRGTAALIPRFYAHVPLLLKVLLEYLRASPTVQVRHPGAPIDQVEIFAKDRAGLVHDLTRCFTMRDLSIDKLLVFAVPPRGELAHYCVRYAPKDLQENEYVLRELRQIPSVISVKGKH